MFDHMTGVEVDHAQAAATYLLTHKDMLGMDASLAVKLDTLRADLTAEQEDRRKIAKH